MSDDKSRSTRRRVLQGVSSAIALTATTGIGAATSKPVDVNVGYRNSRGRRAVEQAADRTLRTFGFDAITIRASPTAVDNLERNPNIRYVEENGRMYPIGQTTPFGVAQVEADLTSNEGHTGEGASVAILDTGVDPDHVDLEANIGQGIDCGSGECREAIADDDGSHGTHVAGTVGAVDNELGVVGVAPNVTLHSVKVLGDDGGTYDAVAAGIEASADAGHDVQNMSFGGGYSYLARDAMQYAAAKGVVMVAAAGNSGCEDCVTFPASAAETIAVSATDRNDELASFSSTGPEIDIAAPGVDVLSTMSADRYGYGSGTSMAAPHVSAAAAVLIATGVTDREELHRVLADSADDIGLTDAERGAGRLNMATAVSLVDDSTNDSTGERITVTTVDASDVTTTSATLHGELTELDGVDSVDVRFEYGQSGEGLAASTASQTVNTTGTVSETIERLESGTDYEFRAVAETADTSDTGDISVFATNTDDTEAENIAPVVDGVSVRTRTTGPWLRAAIDWSVTDDDGNLDTVTTELLTGGAVVDAETNSVSGSTASGDTELRTRGDGDEIRLTVSDRDGVLATTSRTL